MRIALPVLAALLALALPGTAQAITLVAPDGQTAQPFQSWADASLVPTAPGQVVVSHNADGSVYDAAGLLINLCPAAIAAACAVREGDDLWMGPSAGRPTLMHELGHTFDHRVMTGAARSAFKMALGLRGAWEAPGGGNGPSEQFAEAYALCARKRVIRDSVYLSDSPYGYYPSPREHRRACRVIRQAAAGVFG